jgi:signal transduction histidine kinase
MEVLQRQSKDLPSEYQESLDNLTTEIAGLHQMINGVVKFAELMHKQREPEFGHYDLKRLISYAVQPVAVLAQARGVDFRCLIVQNLPKILVDPELLSEAIFQMAHNAVKFNKPDGRAQIRVFESEKQIVIEVSDTGVGLTPARLALLGQPFEQRADNLRRGREGLGVGWAFVGYVAQVHYGYTRVTSPGLDQGSTFTLILPIITERGGT